MSCHSDDTDDSPLSPAQHAARLALRARCAAGEFDGPPLPDRTKLRRGELYEQALSRCLVQRHSQEMRFFQALLEATGLQAHRSRTRIVHYIRDQTRGQKHDEIIDAFFSLAEILWESME